MNDYEDWRETMVVASVHMIGYRNRPEYPYSFEATRDMFDYHYWRMRNAHGLA